MITFRQQPSNRAMAFSPMLYAVTDTDSAKTGFYYRWEVYVWTGSNASLPGTPVITIDKAPRSDFKGLIDISRILWSYFTYNSFSSVIGVDAPTDLAGYAVNVAVKCRGIWDAGSNAFVTSNTIIAFPGWNYYNQDPNANYSSWFWTAPSRKVMAFANTPLIMTITNYDPTIGLNGDVAWRLPGGGYTSLGALDPNNTTTVGALKFIDISPTSIGTSADRYYVATRDNGGDFVDEIEVVVGCSPKYTPIPIYYLDTRGGISTMHAYGATKETVVAEKMNNRTRALDITAGNAFSVSQLGTNRVYDVMRKDTLTINTGLRFESENADVHAIITSRLIRMEVEGDYLPFTCQTNEINDLTGLNDGASINYRLDFSPAYNVINDLR